MADFRTEFPDFPAADMPVIPETFTDTSWHNDVCPSLISETLKLLVFVDYSDLSKREMSEGARFTVCDRDDGDNVPFTDTLLQTDDWSEVLALVDRRKRELVR